MHLITRLAAYLLPACLLIGAPTPELARTVANAHGLADWPSVEQLEFTFGIAKDSSRSRHWQWNVPAGEVTRTIGDDSQTIQLAELTSGEDKKIHRQFINDTFWFIFPFSMAWSNPEVTDHGMTDIQTKTGIESRRKITAQWPTEGGYTPGDAYDIFLDEDNLMVAWTFRKGGKANGKLTLWTEPRQLGPLTITTERRDVKGSVILNFTDIRLKLIGQDTWLLPRKL